MNEDLILAPNEYAFILDETKGNIVNYVGPHKTSLANTDQPVIFNRKTKRFERCKLEAAVQNFAIAPEGWYIVLKNPPSDGKMPRIGTANSLPDLDIGRKVNIPGPVSFAPWPGQMVRVLQGHHLRSNQYLLVRVYDEEGAKANWGKAVIKPQTAELGQSGDQTSDRCRRNTCRIRTGSGNSRSDHGQAAYYQRHGCFILHSSDRH